MPLNIIGLVLIKKDIHCWACSLFARIISCKRKLCHWVAKSHEQFFISGPAAAFGVSSQHSVPDRFGSPLLSWAGVAPDRVLDLAVVPG